MRTNAKFNLIWWRWLELNLANQIPSVQVGRRIYTSSISGGVASNHTNSCSIWKGTLCTVCEKYAGYIVDSKDMTSQDWETLRISMIFPDSGTITDHKIIGRILWFPNG